MAPKSTKVISATTTNTQQQPPRPNRASKITDEMVVKDGPDAIAKAGKGWSKAGEKVAGKVFGDRDDVGILGTGQFKSDKYQVQDKAFESEAATANREGFNKALKNVQGRSAPIMNTGKADQFRNRQSDLATTLENQVAGKTPSVADMQMRRGVNQSLSNANSLAASSRGLSPAMAMRLAQQQQAGTSQDAVGQSAMLRAQEQQSAQQQLGLLSGQARAQDLDTAQNNVSSQLSQRQANDTQERFYREGIMGMDERNRQAAIERERMKSQNSIGYNQINSNAYQAAAENRAGTIGGIAGGIAGMLGMSDERQKTGIQKVDFASPSDSGFKPLSVKLPADDDDDKFEPTIDAADSKRKEDTQKYLKEMGEQKTESKHEKMGKGLGMLGGALAIMSDEKSKKGAVPADGKGKGFLDALQAYTYKYKDPAYGEGQQLGVMAQDLEKTPIGKSLVVDTPEGKMVNYGKAGGIMMANQAMLNDRLSQLESLFKSRAAKRSAA